MNINLWNLREWFIDHSFIILNVSWLVSLISLMFYFSIIGDLSMYVQIRLGDSRNSTYNRSARIVQLSHTNEI